MPNEQEMILQLDSNLFEVFWNTYGSKLNLNKAFIKKVFLAVDLKYKNLIGDSSVSDALLKNVGIFDMVNYVCAEHKFHLTLTNPEKWGDLENSLIEKYLLNNKRKSIAYGGTGL